MYEVTTTTEVAKYECTTADVEVALNQVLISAKNDLPVHVIDNYTGELSLSLNEQGSEDYITDEWRYILIGYIVEQEIGLDALWFLGDDTNP